MLLYNLTFPKDEVCNEKELYFRGGDFRDGFLFVGDGETVAFDTYFNCFSYIKYKKYTKLTTVTLRLEVEGCGDICICRYLDDGKNEVLAKQSVNGTGEIAVDISSIPDKGFLYFTFKADGDAVIRSGGWYTDEEGRDVKIGIVICTYKREEFVKRNIANLTAYMNKLGDKRFFEVFVIDNGRTLTDEFSDGVTIIPNDNTGGSGGFSRGMKEVCESGGYSHFLLMDDDIVFDVEILRRTSSLLALIKDEYKDASVGGGMLVLDRPYLQEELGADWTGTKISSRRKKVDARKADVICANEEQGEPDYNAWFYMCMPTSTPAKYGYPLPFFVRFDDIEYGLRASKNIILTSGIAVWHEGFENKYSPETDDYYSWRNVLILSSRFPRRKGAFANFMKLVHSAAARLVSQRYYALDLLFKAYDDFFKGPKWFMNLDCEKYHLELRKNCPKFLTECELKALFGVSVDTTKTAMTASKHKKKWSIKSLLTLNGYLVPKCFYKKEIGQVNMVKCVAEDFYLYRRVLHFNPATGKGFVTEIKKRELWKCGLRLVKYFFKMMFCYRITAKKYAKL